MRNSVTIVLSLLSLAAAGSACRPDGNDHTVPPRAEADNVPVTVNGCLTAGPDQKRFVLTAASEPMISTAVRSTGSAPTFTYELVGGQNLGAHVGRRVTVQGRLDDVVDSAEFEQERQDAVDTATPRGETPTVTSTQEVEIEVRRLFIESVDASGEPCDTD
jgi:hypothetical protein